MNRTKVIELINEIDLCARRCAKKNDFEPLSRLMVKLSYPPDTIRYVAILRSTYTYRTRLPIWRHLLDEASSWINSRGESAEEVLRGLF